MLRSVLLFITLTLCAAVGSAVETLPHQGVERAYRLISGNGDAATSLRPLIVHLHGFRDPDSLAGSPDLDVIAWRQLEQLAQREDVLVAAPSALKGRWNMGLDLPNIRLEDGQLADDAGFVLKLVNLLVSSGRADPERVYISGISDGATMTQMILCGQRHEFKAAASIIGTMVEQHAITCGATGPVPILVLAGTHDNVLPYDGWMFETGRALSVPEITEFWRQRHGCTGQVAKSLPDALRRDYSRVRQIDWTGCDRPHAVRLLRIGGGGHRVPTLEKPSVFKRGWTGMNHDIETADQMWTFFQMATQ